MINPITFNIRSYMPSFVKDAELEDEGVRSIFGFDKNSNEEVRLDFYEDGRVYHIENDPDPDCEADVKPEELIWVPEHRVRIEFRFSDYMKLPSNRELGDLYGYNVKFSDNLFRKSGYQNECYIKRHYDFWYVSDVVFTNESNKGKEVYYYKEIFKTVSKEEAMNVAKKHLMDNYLKHKLG